ncbi:3-phosphoshikimate 1-carboxyvinyltransferase [Streptomyces tsukubensis]|uniref:3-phosphoshikimate 1-carboxyvinyltransferase n=1 Tax=Streptomyces tsukubensis TaxID=83656 RepID=A0A1V4AG04_9ACTN|nr:3-phosphoshikimate 1-carboxyvinyltransferase [Streptomyces tsukubensis]OON82299.1 3-phosphoshikimate 1-carboxyvinyltransferase [Streptomyces tsukubensis]QFR92788.1 3-phosphoshikimate 1-carboxyvinyltransferase [Streptomyces tsukubensis]
MHLLVKGIQHQLTGEVLVPNSKYHAHRALILASLADGVSRVHGLSDARHVQYTVQLLRGLGVKITTDGDTFVVHGLGGRYRPRRAAVSAGSSGTTLYFMIGLAALSDRPVSVTGQKYFRRRPVGPLLGALRQMGVRLESADDCPPVHVQDHRPTGGHVQIAGTLSQWISGLILLAPFASGHTTIEVQGELNERSYLELTVAMMRQFGLQVTVSDDWRRFDIEPDQEAVPTDLTLPPDIGSAAFGIAAAAIHPSDVLLRGMTRLEGGPADHPEFHFLDIARAMGVPMELDEAAGGVRIQQDRPELKGVTVDCRDVPDMLPILSTLGTFAYGESVFQNIAHTRLKESDRAAAMLQLNSMGGDLELSGDALRVRGVEGLVGAKLSSFNDHRVLMSLAVASSRARGHSTLTYPGAYRISYPTFLDAMNTLGLPMSVENGAGGSAKGASRRLEKEVAKPDLAAGITLPEWLRRRAASRPDDTAVIDVRPDRDEVVTWRGLEERVERAAALLLRLGVKPGENVAYQLPNRVEFVVLSLAALRVGAVCCPIIPFFREREVGFVLRRSKARVLVVADRYRSRGPAEELLGLPARERGELEQVVVISESAGPATMPEGDSDGLVLHDWEQALAETELDEAARAALDALVPTPAMTAQLLFTSGTTGEPKGVTQPSEHLVRAVSMEIKHLGLGARDAVWVPSPLAHQTGFLYGMTLAMVLGVPQIVQSEWDAKRALQSLNEHGATFVQAATPFLSDLVKAVEDGGEMPRKLRIFVATGATVPRGLAERAGRVLGADICGAFGTTETCLGALSAPSDEPGQRWGSDGRALDGIELRVTDDQGRVLPAGEEGNYEIHSPTVFDGYLDRPDLTAEVFTEDGWYRTGDLATIDSAGFLRITGRVKDVINRGGEKIPVAEIEQLLFDHPAVDDVAVVAMPDERLGERACAFVVLKDGSGLSFDDMVAYLDEHQVAKQYWPERLEPIGVLPRNPIGKVQKFELRERARGLRPQGA